jgi:creatine kinase
MRARVARNVEGFSLPSSMDKEERIKFENMMVEIFDKEFQDGTYYSLTPGHRYFIDQKKADELI